MKKNEELEKLIDIQVDDQVDNQDLIHKINDIEKELNTDIYTYISNILKKCIKEEIYLKKPRIDVLIVGNDRIKEINYQTRKIDKITDVLSFPVYEKEEILKRKADVCLNLEYPTDLGSIVINIYKIYEQSIQYNTGIKRELAYMLVHSFCHLLGYDHMLEEDKKEMRQKEEELLENLK